MDGAEKLAILGAPAVVHRGSHVRLWRPVKDSLTGQLQWTHRILFILVRPLFCIRLAQYPPCLQTVGESSWEMEGAHPVEEGQGLYLRFRPFLGWQPIDFVLPPSNNPLKCLSVWGWAAGDVGKRNKGRPRRTRSVTRRVRTGSGLTSGSCQARLVWYSRYHRVTVVVYSSDPGGVNKKLFTGPGIGERVGARQKL
jgi:hypothetical protein